jgi:hypothetical protein
VVPAGPVYVSSLNPRDVLITTFTAGEVTMTVSHVPTGKSVTGKGDSYLRLRERLMVELEGQLAETENKA